MLLLDGAEGTKKITGQNAADGLLGLSGGAKKSEIQGFHEDFIINSNVSGWIRIIETSSATNVSGIPYPYDFEITIKRQWGSSVYESHKISLFVHRSNQQCFFKSIWDNCSAKKIDKIRSYILSISENQNTTKMVVDFYYSSDKQASFNLFVEDAISNIDIKVPKIVVPETPENLVGGIYEHTFKSNSWMDGPDTWPLQ